MTVGVLTLATVLAGLLAGNELSTLTVSHPALDRLPLPTQIAAERVLTRRLGRIMPFVMTTTIAVTVVAAVLLIGEPGFGAMLATTLIGNVPRNRRTEQFPHDGTLEEWRAIRRPWHRLHTARVALDIFAFVALVLAVLVR